MGPIRMDESVGDESPYIRAATRQTVTQYNRAVVAYGNKSKTSKNSVSCCSLSTSVRITCTSTSTAMTAMTTGGILKSGWRFTRRSGGVRLSYAALPPGRKRYTAEKIREAFSHSLSKLGFLRAWNRGSGRPRPKVFLNTPTPPQGLAADVSNVLFLPPANATKRSDCRHFFGWAEVCDFSCNSELKSPSKSGRVSGCRATDICRPVRPRCGTVRTYQYSCFSNQPASSSYYA